MQKGANKTNFFGKDCTIFAKEFLSLHHRIQENAFRMKTRCLLLVALCLQLFSLTTKADGLQVVSSPVDGCFTIAGSVSTDKAIVLYDANDGEVVTTVVDCLLSDLKAVTKKTFMKYKEKST